MPWDMLGVDTSGDYYQWCKENDMYITQEDTVTVLQGSNDDQNFLIIDTRDDDNAGGSIRGALHIPDGSDWEKSIHVLLNAIKEKNAKLVIFHCMESIRRGPRCARRLYNYYMEEGEENMPSIKILQGGADQWVRKYFKTSLVEGFDNDYWGFVDHDETEKEDMHVLYERPSDQRIDSKGNKC